ncbi:MFS transporter, partial [Lactobacillus acetotolerans]
MSKKKTIYTKDVILVMAASFFFMFSTMFVNPLINGYAKSLGASSAFAGLIVGIMSIAAMFLRPVAGNMTDKFSKYRLSLIGGILILIGVIGYVF